MRRVLILAPAGKAEGVLRILVDGDWETSWADPVSIVAIPDAGVIVLDGDAPGADALLARIERERPGATVLVLSGLWPDGTGDWPDGAGGWPDGTADWPDPEG
jgi:hypothetical protein